MYLILNYNKKLGINIDSIGLKTIAQKGQKNVKVKTNNWEKKLYSWGITSTFSGKMLPSLLVYDTKGIQEKYKIQIPNIL